MKLRIQNWNRNAEAGIALLISIFALLLICVAGIAMIVASGTESALTGNYQSSTAVYYAALAGLEEGRGRLTFRNPNYINNSVPNFLPPGGGTLPVGNVLYIVNGNGVNPLDSGNPTSYPDLEYDQEFGPSALSGANAAGTVFTTPSVSPIAGLPGPAYKWVRINAITESSISVDVDGGGQDATTALYYDGAHLNRTNKGGQALEVTALAAYRDGSRKILQYVTSRSVLDLDFPAAVVLSGNNVNFYGPDYNSFVVSGYDTTPSPNCTPPSPGVSGIGYTNNSDSSYSNITASGSYLMNHKDNYEGKPDGLSPNVVWVGNKLSPELQTVAGLNLLVQNITAIADAVISNPPTPTRLSSIAPPGMSSTNPSIVVVNGDLTLDSSTFEGYGLLLVTGKFTYNTNTTWNGIVLVIGKGVLYNNQFAPGKLNGAVLLARTVDDEGNPLGVLGSPSFHFTPTSAGGGVRYSGCWINAVKPRLGYKIVSYREIPQ